MVRSCNCGNWLAHLRCGAHRRFDADRAAHGTGFWPGLRHRADFADQIGFVRELAGFQFRIDELAVDRKFETAATRWFQFKTRDLLLHFYKNLLRQTDGARLIASLRAITKVHLHIRIPFRVSEFTVYYFFFDFFDVAFFLAGLSVFLAFDLPDELEPEDFPNALSQPSEYFFDAPLRKIVISLPRQTSAATFYI